MCWMDFHNGIFCCGFLCARLISLLFCFYFVLLFCVPCVSVPATTPRATTPHLYPTGYHALTTTTRLSLLCIYPGYHAIVYFYSLVVTPELSRSTTHVNRVITPAIVRSSLFTVRRLSRRVFFSIYTTTGRFSRRIRTLPRTHAFRFHHAINLVLGGLHEPQ